MAADEKSERSDVWQLNIWAYSLYWKPNRTVSGLKLISHDVECVEERAISGKLFFKTHCAHWSHQWSWKSEVVTMTHLHAHPLQLFLGLTEPGKDSKFWWYQHHSGDQPCRTLQQLRSNREGTINKILVDRVDIFWYLSVPFKHNLSWSCLTLVKKAKQHIYRLRCLT